MNTRDYRPLRLRCSTRAQAARREHALRFDDVGAGECTRSQQDRPSTPPKCEEDAQVCVYASGLSESCISGWVHVILAMFHVQNHSLSLYLVIWWIVNKGPGWPRAGDHFVICMRIQASLRSS